jgi:SAM-dependent methyltransferase
VADNYWDLLMADDAHAATYMETYGEGPNCPTRHKIGEFVQPGESVLDVGCGPGWNFDYFREYGPRIVRVANERFLQKYSPSGRRKTLPDSLPFRKGDVRHITEPNASWDVVILQDVLEHTNGYEGPVKEALRVAKKRVIVVFWHLTDNDDHINDDGDDGYGAWYSRPKWEAFLNTLPYVWMDTDIEYPAGRQRDFYVIRKDGDDV